MFPFLIPVGYKLESSHVINSVPKHAFPLSSVLRYSKNFLRWLLLIGVSIALGTGWFFNTNLLPSRVFSSGLRNKHYLWSLSDAHITIPLESIPASFLDFKL